MKIKYKLAIQFTAVVGLILLIFSLIIYQRADYKRRTNFYDRLQRRAETTARLFADVDEVTPEILKIIDKNSSARLNGEQIYIYNFKNQLIYSNVNQLLPRINQELINQVRLKTDIRFMDNFPADTPRQYAGLLFQGKNERYVVIISAFDVVGSNDKKSLLETLMTCFVIAILIVVGVGIFFARQALQPIKSINQQVDMITAQNLKKRVAVGKSQDEIAELAQNFNQMLNRLELAFEQQNSFVSHASHELRTPLAAMKSEIQLGLEEKHSLKEHQEILKNLWQDTDRLIQLSNGLLQLARSIDSLNGFTFTSLRVEELIFAVQSSLCSLKPMYSIRVNFAKIPENEEETMVKGSSVLLKNIFQNLLDNACKYSTDHHAEVLIDFDEIYCIVKIIDSGIGIPPEALPKIFTPFYRAGTTSDYAGFGIGLSICKKIIDLHQGKISVESQLGEGSVFTVSIKHIPL